MSSRTSLYVRTTPDEHRIAEELLAARGEKSLSKMMIALLLEEHKRTTDEQNRSIVGVSIPR